MIGRSFSHFRIVSLLGQGGMGVVYQAEDVRLGRQVAIKFLPESAASDPQALERMQREARAASALNHPHICTVYEIDELDGQPFIVMELLEGLTLREHLRARRPGIEAIVALAAQAAEALAAAHAKGIVHRDIKSANIFVTNAGQVKILDFGLAKVVDDPGSGDTATVTSGQAADAARAVLTSPGQMLGTIAYMSPEQVRGEELDARTDLFSLGVVLYEMLTGALPFDGATTGVVFDKILNRAPAPVTEKVPQVSHGLVHILDKALEKDRELRYQSARELRADLARLSRASGSSAGHAIPQPASSPSVAPPVARPRRLWLVAGAAMLAIAAVTAWLLWKPAPRVTETAAGPAALSRLTFDDGLQMQPTWSPDGKFVAYTSDQSGNFDIWVQPVAGGRAIQVTTDPAADWQPDWSPDGNSLAFRSERDGGGIFVVPALGGRERRLSTFGVMPQWSPKGTELMFQVRTPTRAAVQAFSPPVYLVGLDGAAPRRVLEKELAAFGSVTQVVWHPDGKHVTFHGHTTGNDGHWTVPIAGGEVVHSEYADDVARNMEIGNFRHASLKWAPTGDAVYIEAVSSGSANLWRVGVDPATLRWISGPERLTTGLGTDVDVAVAPDGRTLAFVTGQFTARLWSLPLDPRTGSVSGAGQALTGAGMSVVSFDLSADDRRLTYVASRTGKTGSELWSRSLADGAEAMLAEGFVSGPRVSRDGSAIAYTRAGSDGQPKISWTPATGAAEHVMSLDAPSQGAWGWTPDGAQLLHRCPPSVQPGASLCASPKDVTSLSKARIVIHDPAYAIWQGQYSPDGRFVLFNAQDRKSPDLSILGVVAAAGGPWTKLTSEKIWADKARWSADGRTIYFISNRGGAFFDVWGVRFDPATGRTVGDEFRVTKFDNPGHLLNAVSAAELGVSASRIVVPIAESTGSIWVLQRGGR